MLPAFVITLREGVEAALIVGIVAAFLVKQGRRDAMNPMWLGVGLAIGLCAAVAIGLRVGGWGTAGSIAVYAESRFNMENRYYAGPLLYWAYGFDELMLDVRELVWEFEEYTDVDWIGPDDFMFPQTPTCTLPWAGFDVLVAAPIACYDVVFITTIDCEHGFVQLDTMIEHIDIGGARVHEGLTKMADTILRLVDDPACSTNRTLKARHLHLERQQRLAVLCGKGGELQWNDGKGLRLRQLGDLAVHLLGQGHRVGTGKRKWSRRRLPP